MSGHFQRANLVVSLPFTSRQCRRPLGRCATVFSLGARYVDHVIARRYLLEFVLPKGNDGAVRHEVVDAAKPELTRILTLLDDQLAEGTYLVGDTLIIADAIVAPMLDYLSGLPAAAGFLAESGRLCRKAPKAPFCGQGAGRADIFVKLD